MVVPAGDDEEEDEFEDALPVFADDVPPEALHRAAFANDVAALSTALRSLPRGDWGALDRAGNTAAHVAVLRGSRDALELLLARGAPCDSKSAAGWRVHGAACVRLPRQLSGSLCGGLWHAGGRWMRRCRWET